MSLGTSSGFDSNYFGSTCDCQIACEAFERKCALSSKCPVPFTSIESGAAAADSSFAEIGFASGCRLYFDGACAIVSSKSSSSGSQQLHSPPMPADLYFQGGLPTSLLNSLFL